MTDQAVSGTVLADEGPGFADAAAELIATIADEGVQHLFINPGTDTAPVQEALAAAAQGRHP